MAKLTSSRKKLVSTKGTPLKTNIIYTNGRFSSVMLVFRGVSQLLKFEIDQQNPRELRTQEKHMILIFIADFLLVCVLFPYYSSLFPILFPKKSICSLVFFVCMKNQTVFHVRVP